jgi:hypothetical protein
VQTVGEIDLVTSSLDAVTPVTSQVNAILDRQHFKKSGPQEDFTVTTYQSDKLAIGSHLLRVLFWGVAGVAAVALLVGFSGLVSIMRAEATARAEEFQRCRRGAVVVRMLTGALLFAVLAGFMGVGAGAAVVAGGQQALAGLAPQYGLPYLSGASIVLVLVLSVATGLTAGIGPAWAATRSARPSTPMPSPTYTPPALSNSSLPSPHPAPREGAIP